MSLAYLGQTRSSRKADHLLQTPDTFVRAALPGMSKAVAIIHAGPQLGARFTQFTAELEAEGTLGLTSAQRFLYVLEGSIVLKTGGAEYQLATAGYAYLPAGVRHEVAATSAARLAVIEKPYQSLSAIAAPQLLVGSEEKVAPQALMGDPDLLVRPLLPDMPAFDFAVNTMTYEPGASLNMVEVHVMEHGLLMLSGAGIYRLGDCWYPVESGDFIWMAPYCPQWFGALGKSAARYLIYKDWNRHPIGL